MIDTFFKHNIQGVRLQYLLVRGISIASVIFLAAVAFSSHSVASGDSIATGHAALDDRSQFALISDSGSDSDSDSHSDSHSDFGSAATPARQFTYEVQLGPFEQAGVVDVYIPLAVESEQQSVIHEKIVAPFSGQIESEDQYGNRYWHGRVDVAISQELAIKVKTVFVRHRSMATSQTALSSKPAGLDKFLIANDKVPVGHEILEPIRAEIAERAKSDAPADVARAIYDWVVDNVEYKKVGSGWGNGDTFWACNERYGNCTDFHALFISLARSEGIPAKFEIGFPVPEDRSQGKISGYHCWVQFYLPETGWFPIDASEAFKAPEKRDFYYGSHPGDRIHFSTGRDLRLHAGQKNPLNYFVYPYIEMDGVSYTGEVARKFSYSDHDDGSQSLPGELLTSSDIQATFSNVRDSAKIQDQQGTTAENIWYADGRFVNHWQNSESKGTVRGTWVAENNQRCVLIESGFPSLNGQRKCGPIYRRGTEYLSTNADGSVHAVHTLKPID